MYISSREGKNTHKHTNIIFNFLKKLICLEKKREREKKVLEFRLCFFFVKENEKEEKKMDKDICLFFFKCLE